MIFTVEKLYFPGAPGGFWRGVIIFYLCPKQILTMYTSDAYCGARYKESS